MQVNIELTWRPSPTRGGLICKDISSVLRLTVNRCFLQTIDFSNFLMSIQRKFYARAFWRLPEIDFLPNFDECPVALPDFVLWQHECMSQIFGIETPGKHAPQPHRKPVRYLVIIDAGGSMIARLFLETRESVAEFDAAVEEVAAMTQGLVPEMGAIGSEWDRALLGHNTAERAAARIFTLEI